MVPWTRMPPRARSLPPTKGDRNVRWFAGRRAVLPLVVLLGLVGACDAPVQAPLRVLQPGEALSDSVFAALHARISEAGGYFDTDNLISNEAGYLKVMGALEDRTVGGAFIGVGPDQNFSYVAALLSNLVFIVDIRRDNALEHLLLKALIERSPTRIEFLAALHGREPPGDPAVWAAWDIEDIVAWVDEAPADPEYVKALHEEVAAAVTDFGIPLDDADLATIRRFHQTFVDAGMGLRFTTIGRAPRPYYPTYRQLVLETDAEGRQASYLATPETYATVRDLQLANRVIPVVGDLAGPKAVREIGQVLREYGLSLSAIYTSNVEFYLWRSGTFSTWVDNLASVPAHDDALVIRSYFPSFGANHPSALPGYYATQTLQSVETLVGGGSGRPFTSYWDVVTRGALEIRAQAGR